MTFRTVAAQTAMSKGRNICHCDLLSRQDSRKDQIKYSYFGMHDASWKSQYRSAVCIIGQKEHSSRKHRRTISNDFTSRISNGRWCQIIRIHRHTACTEDHISTLIQPVFDGLFNHLFIIRHKGLTGNRTMIAFHFASEDWAEFIFNTMIINLTARCHNTDIKRLHWLHFNNLMAIQKFFGLIQFLLINDQRNDTGSGNSFTLFHWQIIVKTGK